MLDGPQVPGVHDVGAVLVFHDGHELAGAAHFLNHEDLLGLGVAFAVAAGAGEHRVGLFARFLEVEAVIHGLCQCFAGVGVHGGIVCLVFPAAGVGAGALVGVAAVEVTRQQAAARIGNTQRAVHEDFDLHVGAFLADLLNLVQAQLAREDDARHARLLPELHRGVVGGVGLHGEVNLGVGPLFLHHHHQAGVGHDEGVRLQLHHRRDVADIGAHLVVVRDQVAGDEELLAARVRFFNALGDLLQAEFVVARAQAVARLAGIHGIGAEVVRCAHLVERASGQQQFGGFQGHGA
ncbi:hypothetical protein SDC9_142395 [bioreactor metagenome]|uniref:NAD-specific glutamate dehydrogenase n=1 Tax=bioreactor metagenome TaxID=1076179 RepID=A0A645E117_9ZZZZ